VEVLAKYNWCEDVNTMMTRVNRKVALGAPFFSSFGDYLFEIVIFDPNQ
jgi:hypothetical protein